MYMVNSDLVVTPKWGYTASENVTSPRYQLRPNLIFGPYDPNIALEDTHLALRKAMGVPQIFSYRRQEARV